MRTGFLLLAAVLVVAAVPGVTAAEQTQQVTFAKDVAPILQRSCQVCHRPNNSPWVSHRLWR